MATMASDLNIGGGGDKTADADGKAVPSWKKGPHGLGDPEDRSLRKVEKEVMIPMKMREKAKLLKCTEEVAAFTECCKKSSVAMVVTCRPQNFQLKACLTKWWPKAIKPKAIKKEYEGEGQRIEEAIEVALKKAAKLGILGKDMTPFLLSEINQATEGATLAANKRLVENNVRVATRIAVLLAKLRRTTGTSTGSGNLSSQGRNQTCTTCEEGESLSNLGPNGGKVKGRGTTEEHSYPILSRSSSSSSRHGRPVVVGGCSMDLIMSIQETEIVADGRTHRSSVRTVPGGVGRNMAEALGKLGHSPFLISPVGDDLFGKNLKIQLEDSNVDVSKILTLNNSSTAIYSAILNHQGECIFGLGDMTIYDRMTARFIEEECQGVIRDAGFVVLDANLALEVISSVLRCCHENNVPVWFEPTEIRKAKKILEVPKEFRAALRYVSPNLKELLSLTEIDQNGDLSTPPPTSPGTNNTVAFDLSQRRSLYESCFSLYERLELILLTQGKDGIQVISQKAGNDGLCIESFPPPQLQKTEILSVSGAGDCLNAGFISSVLEKRSLAECAIKGTLCARKSLQSLNNVPDRF